MPPPLLLLQDISVTFEVTGPASGRGLRGFEQCSNAFRNCAGPKRLQELADSLTAEDLLSCGQKWLARFTPVFHRKRAQTSGVSAPLVLLSDRVLRQPDLSSSLRARQAG